MNYKSARLFFLMLSGVSFSTFTQSLEIKDLGMMNIKNYALRLANDSYASSLTVTPGKSLIAFESIFDSIDLATFPAEVSHTVYAVKSIKAKYDLNQVVMLGDLYTILELRGNGYAKNLLALTCAELFSQGFKAVLLIPDPFEYENGKQVLVSDEDKMQKLVQLYQILGFKMSEDHKFMYLEKSSN